MKLLLVVLVISVLCSRMVNAAEINNHMQSYKDEKISQISNINDQVNCSLIFDSRISTPTQCLSQIPLPVKVTLTIRVDQEIYWHGSADWIYYLQGKDDHGKDFQPGSCIYGQTPDGNMTPGSLITLTLTCYKTPRPLQKGDNIIIVAFYYHSNYYWCGVRIPIIGINNLPQTQKYLSSVN